MTKKTEKTDTASSADDVVAQASIEAIKGFDKTWKCRDFQFSVGKTYVYSGRVKACSSGFHAVEMPLDVFSYYPLSSSVYASVELSGEIDRENNDSKIAARSINIRAEISLPEIISRAVAWVLNRAKGNTATGYRGHAAATGYRGHAAATGERGHAAATGYRGHAAATGDNGHAAATGYSGHAAATGDNGHAAATGYSGHAAATGERGHAAATGYSGHAAATGYSGHAAATGYSGHAAATGDNGHAAATGDNGHAAATGYRGHAAATGYRGHAAATGYRGHAAATGYRGHAAATGYSGHAAATGYRGHAAATGKQAIAASFGIEATAMAGIDGWIVLANWQKNKNGEWEVTCVKSAKVGGPEGVEPKVTYRLSDEGNFVKAE